MSLEFLVLVLFASAALNLAIGVYNYWKHRMHPGWQQVMGHVESSELRNDQKDSYLLEMLQRNALEAEIGYSFPAQGSFYSGHNDVVFRDEAEAWNYIDRHKKGDQVSVYYDPADPSRSAIEPGSVNSGRYLLAGVGFLVLGIYILNRIAH